MSIGPTGGDASAEQLAARFKRMHAASRQAPYPPLDLRKDRLERLLAIVAGHGPQIEQAIAADFGHRSVHETRLAEVATTEASIKHALRYLRHWMKPRRASTSVIFWPGRNRRLAQPVGVAGIIAPWNYPLQLTLGPAIGAIAAGNRVMLKPSELAPRFADLLKAMIAERFADDEVTTVTGGPEVSQAFAALPFDHLLFTGSTRVGQQVAQAAARNLTPVTLELGGKSPAIVHPSASIETAASRIAFAKILNAGQTCIAPDYVICSARSVDAFCTAYRKAVARMIGSDAANPDYSCIISERHAARLDEMIADARAKGARVIDAVDDPGAWASTGKRPPCLVVETTPAMRVRQEEIFGPILPVVAADTDEAALEIVNAGDRPLALYWFGNDRGALDRVLRHTVAGGVTVNDCLMHQAQEDQPFGGVGASGQGAYHGEWGFRTFSKEKPIFYRPALSGITFMQPPYGRRFARMLALMRWLS